MGDYTEEEFQREFVDERTLDEEYEVDSRKIAHTEECSGVQDLRNIFLLVVNLIGDVFD